MAFYDNETPFWVVHTDPLNTNKPCASGHCDAPTQLIFAGELASFIEWRRDPENPNGAIWTVMHPDCAITHPYNEENLAGTRHPNTTWNAGTQRDVILNGQFHAGQVCEYRLDPAAPRGKQWLYRPQQQNPTPPPRRNPADEPELPFDAPSPT